MFWVKIHLKETLSLYPCRQSNSASANSVPVPTYTMVTCASFAAPWFLHSRQDHLELLGMGGGVCDLLPYDSVWV